MFITTMFMKTLYLNGRIRTLSKKKHTKGLVSFHLSFKRKGFKNIDSKYDEVCVNNNAYVFLI